MNHFLLTNLPDSETINSFPLEGKILLANYLKLFVLKKIKSIKPKLHKIVLSTEYNYSQFEKFFNKITIHNKPRNCNYEKTATTTFSNREITILYKPINGYLPKSIFELHNFNRKKITEIYKIIGNVNVSEIEYTIDFLCSNYINARNLLYLFMKYIYIPYSKNVKLDGNKKSNFTYYIRNASKSRNLSIKVYERAGPRKKPKKGFEKNKIDRVRLEITAPREKLKQKGIFELKDILNNCYFSEIAENTFHFKKFKNRCDSFSKEWEHRPNIFSYDNKIFLLYSFQKEYTETKISNPNQYIENASGFRELQNLIKKSISSFY